MTRIVSFCILFLVGLFVFFVGGYWSDIPHAARPVVKTAISYSELLLQAKRVSEANRWASWADELDRKAELGPVFTERIARLKEGLAKATR